MWYSISSFSVKCSISAAAEGILWCSLQLQLFPFSLFFPFCHVSPHCSLLWAFAIKGVYYGGGKKKNHHDPSISTHERVSYNGPRTLGHVCEIIWAVTPPDKGVINKNHFPAVLQPPRWFLFLLAGCISLRAPLRSVSARPRGHPVIPRRRFHTKRKRRGPIGVFAAISSGYLDGWMQGFK